MKQNPIPKEHQFQPVFQALWSRRTSLNFNSDQCKNQLYQTAIDILNSSTHLLAQNKKES